MPEENLPVTDQGQASAQAGEQGSTEASGSNDAIGENQQLQSEGQSDKRADEALGVEGLSPELAEKEKELTRAFHEKTQKLAEDRRTMQTELRDSKEKAQLLQQVMSQGWFKDAMAAEKARREGVGQEDISPEEFANTLADPKEFRKAVRREAEAILIQKYGGRLDDISKAQQDIAAEREIERVSGKFSDFDELNQQGVFDSYLKENLSFERAYRLYKSENGQPVQLRTRANPKPLTAEQKQAGSVGKVTPSQADGARIIKAKTLDDAFDKAWELASQGKAYKLEKG